MSMNTAFTAVNAQGTALRRRSIPTDFAIWKNAPITEPMASTYEEEVAPFLTNSGSISLTTASVIHLFFAKCI